MSDKSNSDSSSLPLSYYPDSTNDPNQFYQLPRRAPTQLETLIKSLRLNVQEATNVVMDVIDTGKAHSQGTYQQLLDEENVNARLAVIGGLATLGYVVGTLRGKRLKKLFYTTTGLAVGSSLCYPQATQELVSSMSHTVKTGEIPQISLPQDVANIVKPEDVTAFLNSVMVKMTDFYNYVVDAIQSSTKSNLTVASTTVEKDTEVQSTAVEKDTKIVFVQDKAPIDQQFQGDYGMSKEEDKDMYTTRG